MPMETFVHATGLEAVPIDTIRASNAQAGNLEGLVVVFVGGTGGIGRNVAHELFANTRQPKAYIIGRSEANGTKVCDELRELNSEGTAVFLQKDISLVRNVDEVCAEILRRERKIHGLVLTAGYMTLGARDETDEGIDKRMAVNYYCRMRFIFNLQPALDVAVEDGELSRVITVLAAGSETEIVHLDDLDLRYHWNLHECLAHCVIMSDFMVEEFARRHQSTAYSHSFPGNVKSGIANNLTSSAKIAVKVLYATMNTWILNVKESGERHFFQLTSQCFPSAARSVGVPVPEGLSRAHGTNSKPGSGAYLLDWDCKPTGDAATLAKYRGMGLGATIWQHTQDVLNRAAQKSRKDSKRPASDEPEGAGQRQIPNPTGWRPA